MTTAKDGKHTTVITSDEPVSVHVETGGGHWFRIFTAIVDTGIWADLSPSAAKVLVVLTRHVNDGQRQRGGDWLAWPSVTTIMKLAGTKRAATYQAIAELEQRKLLTRRNGGGGRNTTTYQLIEPPVHARGPVHAHGPQGSTHTNPTRPRTRTRSRLNEEDRKKQQVDAAAGDVCQDVLEALVAAGISEPTRTQLATLSGVTTRLVEQVAERAISQGKGVGVIVNDIRAKAAANVAKRERARAKRQVEREMQATQQQQRETEREEQERIDSEMLTVNRFINSMSDNELEQARQDVLDSMTAMERKAVERLDVKKSRTLKRRIYNMANQRHDFSID